MAVQKPDCQQELEGSSRQLWPTSANSILKKSLLKIKILLIYLLKHSTIDKKNYEQNKNLYLITGGRGNRALRLGEIETPKCVLNQRLQHFVRDLLD